MSELSRKLSKLEVNVRPFLEIDSQRYLDFSSNDYLALRFDKDIQKSYKEGVDIYGIGSGGSPLVCGYDQLKSDFEKSFSNYINAEQSLLFNSGYTANLSVFSSLYLNHDVAFFLDKSCHASIYDALSMRDDKSTKIYRYPHNDLKQLEKLLYRESSAIKIIVSEGIFSMTGQQSEVSQLVKIKYKYNAKLIIDDAHCIGVKGSQGKGSAAYVNAGDIDILICPLGKAFAMQGGVVSASKEIINNLVINARPYIYSTAIGSALVYALYETLNKIKSSGLSREKLEANISYFKQQRAKVNYKFLDSNSAIQYLIIANAKLALKLFEQLKQEHIFCYPMREPTVAKKNTGFRIVLSSAHTKEHINKLFSVLRNCLEA